MYEHIRDIEAAETENFENLGEQNMPAQEHGKHARKGNGKTAAKVVGIGLSVLALVGTLYIGYEHVGDAVDRYQEGKRVESAVTYFMNEDQLVALPDTVLIDQNYDEDFCKGETLRDELTIQGADYCYIDGQYYTEKGEDIAILTLEVTRNESIAAQAYETNGNIVYMAPEGYELKGARCYKTITTTITKVVPKSENGDYSHISVDNADKAVIINIETVSTKKYSTLAGYDLICDVEDGAELTDGYCEAELRLKKRK